MTRSGQLILHVGVPLLVGLVMGLNQARVGEHLSLPLSVFYWTLASLGAWWIFELMTRAVAVLLRPWSPPLIVVLLIGMLLASVPGRAFLYGFADALSAYRVDGTMPRSPPPISLSLTFLGSFVLSWAGFFIFWLGSNLALVYLLGVARFGCKVDRRPLLAEHSSEPLASPATNTPRFMTRVPPHLGQDVLALSAQDHYLEVHTAKGKALIHYTLSEAVSQLNAAGFEGLRVHRSHWVARDALIDVKPGRRGYLVRVSNGLEVPIGTTYIGLLKDSGVIPARHWQAA